MARPIDELKSAMAVFKIAAEPVLKMLAAAEILTKSADHVSGLEVREGELRQSIAELDVSHKEKMLALQVKYDDTMKALDDAVTASRLETDRVIARTKREATDLIKTTEQDRQSVNQALQVVQKELFELRRQLADERKHAESERQLREGEFLALKGRHLTEIRDLEVRIAELRKLDAEIQERLAAVSAARR